ncbi:Uncharacterised protein [Salmonella enterica subsp. diarizonae]|nr:Uncharacterised protein [Salmonella enterica subsp. diarizonae]
MRGKKNRITTGSMSVVCSEGNFLGGASRIIQL